MSFDLSMAAAAIAGLLLISAFFSGAETALTATSRARLTELERRGNWRASIVLSLTKPANASLAHFCWATILQLSRLPPLLQQSWLRLLAITALS